MLQKYQDYVKLNKNIIIAFAVSITISAIIAQVLEDQEDYLNTTYTIIVDQTIYFSTFGILYYFDNKKKYLLETGTIDKPKLRHDLLRITTSVGLGEVVYTIVRWFLQYYLLIIDYDPYMASIISQSISIVIYILVVNLIVKITRLYKDGN